GWRYGGGSPRLGVTARWGITPNLTLHGTARPDFSQVEADVPQIQFDPRTALRYPEKRPFFLDGLELFQTPIQLIYTRRLVDPQAAATLTGKTGPITIATLAGVDGTEASLSGSDHPLLGALRLRRDFGGASNLGVVFTDREDGSGFNRVAAADGKVALGGPWQLIFQGGGSVTRDSAGAPLLSGPIWRAGLTLAGRRFGFTATSYGVSDDFRTRSGFITRSGVVQDAVTPSYTFAGAPGALLESVNVNCFCALTWDEFRHFSAGRSPDDRQADMSAGFSLRGGWQLGLALSVETFGYPEPLFTNYWIERTQGATVDTIPFTGTPQLPNLDWAVNLATPNFQRLSLSAFLLGGRDENFFEWASAHVLLANVDLAWRPTDRLRTELIYDHQQVVRPDDGSMVSLIRVPRLKVEYQLSRPIFLRVVAQYSSNETDSLRDDSRTNGAILFRDPTTGAFTRSSASASNAFRVDGLFSYRPTPGTVVFVGYGNSLDDGAAFRFTRLARTADEFFVKLSYLFRG
ncbi:MAG TPA: DUF5916 domain-containing protein, partial [Gemmatimonadales bacterium]